MQSADKKIQDAIAGLYKELKTPYEYKAAHGHLLAYFPDLAEQLQALAAGASKKVSAEQDTDPDRAVDEG